MPRTSRQAQWTGGTAVAPGRDPFFDNAKYLAIVLVACAHSWEPYLPHHRVVLALYDTVYAFHMPAFVLVSGYFSRRFELSPGKARRLVTGVLFPYVVFELAYTVFRRRAGDEPSAAVSLLDPWWLNWFLAALFLWRLTAPLWRNVRWPLAWALLVSVFASMTPNVGPDLGLQRALQFSPFFVLGLIARPEHFARVRRRAVRLAALPVTAGAAVLAYWAAPRLNWAWFYREHSGPELGTSAATGGVMALALFGCSVLLVACFLAWVPARRTWFTALGAGTLYGYLLHGFLIKGAVYWGWYDHVWTHSATGTLVVTAAAGAWVTLLCTPPVRQAFRFAVEPRMEWMFHPRPEPASAGSSGVSAPPPEEQPDDPVVRPGV
jgi:fucose 4-O-acetylase-like acetyltransferase